MKFEKTPKKIIDLIDNTEYQVYKTPLYTEDFINQNQTAEHFIILKPGHHLDQVAWKIRKQYDFDTHGESIWGDYNHNISSHVILVPATVIEGNKKYVQYADFTIYATIPDRLKLIGLSDVKDNFEFYKKIRKVKKGWKEMMKNG